MGVLNRGDFLLLDNLIKKYTLVYIRSEFIEKNNSITIDVEEVRTGLTIANMMASMEEELYRKKALEYASVIANIATEQDILRRCEKIFDQLSFFTFGDVLKKRKEYNKNLIHSIGITAFSDLYQKEVYTRTFAGKKIELNNFQLLINDKFDKVKNFSISAPTSIGKSFLMRKVVIKTVLNISFGKVIYLVPTRALINEVISDFQSDISELKLEEEIFISCSSEINEEMIYKKGIFILTQERVNQLCCNCNQVDIKVDLLVVDEAQQIGEGSRGILLEYTIKRMRELWRDIRIFFASPLIDNPEVYINKFKLEDSFCKYETISSVNQNLITLTKVHRASRISVKYENEEVGTFKFIGSNYHKLEEKIAYIISQFRNNENSLIYCNIPSYTRKICNELNEYIRFDYEEDEEVKEFCEFLRSYICKEYELANLVEKRVAYHYSKLPSIIKTGIEDLAKNGKLKFIACTSTLLEGINIQANSIYIFNAKKLYKELSNLEFWNLAGRAGRMNRDLCGNIICIDLDNSEYPEGYSSRNIEKVVFKKDRMLNDNLNDFKEYIVHKKDIQVTRVNKEQLESNQNLESILILEKLEGKDLRVLYDREEIGFIDEIITKKINDSMASEELLKKLVGIDIEAINKLWNMFNLDYKRIERYFLINPFLDNAEERLAQTLKYINIIFFYNRYTDDALEYIRKTSLMWMRENSLRDLIFGTFNPSEHSAYDINKRIENKLELLNSEIRFNISKYLYAYQEILKEVLILNGGNKYIEKLCNYPLYLEFGASRKKTLEIMYLGIFREGAIILAKYISVDEPGEILRQLRKIDVDSINTSGYIKKKLKEKIGML